MIALRAPGLGDAEAVFEVLRERDIVDTGAPHDTLEDVLEEWHLADVDLREDARIAEQDGQILGYSIVRRQGTLIAVDPRVEFDDVGRALLAWSEERGHARGHDTHKVWIGAVDAPACELLTAAGYALVRSYWRMVRDLDGAERLAPAVPNGVRMRALDVAADAAAVHALDDRSFATVPDYNPSTLAQFREEHLAAHDLDPALSVIAEADGSIVGFALTKVWSEERTGFVDVLAVEPRYQGRGLGSALLRQAFAGYAAAGLHQAQLGVATDNPPALRLYERVGMRQKFRFDVYERAAG